MAEENPSTLLLLYLYVYCVSRVCRNRLARGDVDDVQEKPQADSDLMYQRVGYWPLLLYSLLMSTRDDDEDKKQRDSELITVSCPRANPAIGAPSFEKSTASITKG